MNCLWLSRAMPYPLTSGDRIYSAKLAASLANAGAEVVFVGLLANGLPKSAPGIVWDAVPGRQRRQTTAVLSPLPLVAAMHATRTYRSHAAALVGSQRWDAITDSIIMAAAGCFPSSCRRRTVLSGYSFPKTTRPV